MGDWVDVDSSMIDAVRYNAKEKVLEVMFNSGQVYSYEDVPRKIYKELLEADSKGRFMRDEIIDCYPYFKGTRRRRK